jgi:hypothetical protein
MRSVPRAITKERTGAREDDDIGVSFLIKQGEWATNTEISAICFASYHGTKCSSRAVFECTNGLPFPRDL